MCGIIAVTCSNTEENKRLIFNLLLNSKIRGLHSTGVSLIDNSNKIVTIKDNLPSDKFLEKHWDSILEIIDQMDNIQIIGHTRYSTSGDFAQPIEINTDIEIQSSLVFNGVVTQSDPSTWGDIIPGYQFKSDNDGEILKYCLDRDYRSVVDLYLSTEFSASVCYMDNSGIVHFRTGDRPSWIFKSDDIVAISSTREIMIRSGLTENLNKTAPGILYKLINCDEYELISNILDIQI